MKEIELDEFLKSTISQIEASVDSTKRWIKNGIDIEVSISKVDKIDGGLKIYIFNSGVSREVQEVSKIKFTVMPFLTEEQIEEMATWTSIDKN